MDLTLRVFAWTNSEPFDIPKGRKVLRWFVSWVLPLVLATSGVTITAKYPKALSWPSNHTTSHGATSNTATSTWTGLARS